MKFLLVLGCLFVASNALDKKFVEEFLEKMQEIGAKCIVETKASDDDVAQLLSHQIPTTHEGQCMIFCFHKAFNVQNEDGVLNKEGALQSLEPLKAADADLHEKFVKIFNTCIDSIAIDADPCVTATNLAQCGMKEGKAMGLSDDLFEM